MDRDEARFPPDSNGDVLFNLHCDGDSLTVSRPVDFQLIFEGVDGEANARACAERVAELGWHSDVEQWEAEDLEDVPEHLPWDVKVVVEMLPTHAEITRIESLLDAEAQRLGGHADGWGCFTVK
jgi:hypothetical protein